MTSDLGLLSDREIEVLRLVADGKTNQQIARELVISPNTVKVHLRNIFEKMGVQSRTEATMEAVRRGWVGIHGVPVAPSPEEAGGGQPLARDVLATEVVVETAAQVETASAPPGRPAEPAPYRSPIGTWQRIYMFLVAALILLALLAPAWWRSRSQASTLTPLSDAGLAPVSPAPRPQVSRWIAGAPLPEARSRVALATDGTRLYVIGGETSAGVTGQVSIYDPHSNGWQSAAAKPTAVANAAAAWLSDRIYVPGGTTRNGTPTNAVEAYDPRADRWEAVAPLPSPLAAYALASLNGRLYLFGGWNGARSLSDTWIYDPMTASWSSGTSMPEPRAFLAASSLEGVIYVVGGYDGQRELSTVTVYDPAGEGTDAGPWSARAALTQSRGGLGLVSLGPRLYAVGGGWTEPMAYNEQYDTRTGAWSRIETPVVGQWRNLGLAALGNRLYAVGGWGGSQLSTNEEYLALLQQLLPLFTRGE